AADEAARPAPARARRERAHDVVPRTVLDAEVDVGGRVEGVRRRMADEVAHQADLPVPDVVLPAEHAAHEVQDTRLLAARGRAAVAAVRVAVVTVLAAGGLLPAVAAADRRAGARAAGALIGRASGDPVATGGAVGLIPVLRAVRVHAVAALRDVAGVGRRAPRP